MAFPKLNKPCDLLWLFSKSDMLCFTAANCSRAINKTSSFPWSTDAGVPVLVGLEQPYHTRQHRLWTPGLLTPISAVTRSQKPWKTLPGLSSSVCLFLNTESEHFGSSSTHQDSQGFSLGHCGFKAFRPSILWWWAWKPLTVLSCRPRSRSGSEPGLGIQKIWFQLAKTSIIGKRFR